MESAPHPQPLSTGWPDDPLLEHLLPLIRRAERISVVAAFVRDSGLGLLERPLLSALRRGAQVRLLTSDYLHATQARGLQRLLSWSADVDSGLLRERDDDDPDEPPPREGGRLEVRVIEMARLGAASFHPKAWCLAGPDLAAAFVGSSNISRAALRDGVEWNLRIDGSRDALSYQQVADAFARAWERGQPLTAAWVAAYEEAAARAAAIDLGTEDAGALPAPHELQAEALRCLASARREGRRRALVVMATGLGKTLLAAFDIAALGRELGRAPRVLVLAHRGELLRQARGAILRTAGGSPRFSLFAGESADLGGDVVLASVQKLSRPEHLARLGAERFDYVLIDEVHHAAARSYRDVLAALDAGFVLGITATPDRADAADLVGLFEQDLAYRADLAMGIARGLLCPFSYHGIRDDVDYRQVPWRDGRFSTQELTDALSTSPRMDRLWQVWQDPARPGRRTLVFCCSVRHARFAAAWLRARGVRAAAVHSADDSYDRERALRELAAGELDAVCAVDLFNEGIDVPLVDRVVMLRPTESPVLFLQQLGRGLRRAPGKERLQVIDFVGNHRIFLSRLRVLLQAAAQGQVSLRQLLDARAPLELPAGCLLDIELVAIDLLRHLMPAGETSIEQAYRELRALRERRPTPSELWRERANPGALQQGWFRFVAEQGDLSEAEGRCLAAAERWLDAIGRAGEVEVLALRALLDGDALRRGLPVFEIAGQVSAARGRAGAEGVSASQLVAACAGRGGNSVLRREADHLVAAVVVPAEDEARLAEMARELVDYRLLRTRRTREEEAAHLIKVIWNKKGPILSVPREMQVPRDGLTPARLPDGGVWQFKFVAVACNTAAPAGQAPSGGHLHALLRGWFGPQAGMPGRSDYVRLWWEAGELQLAPVITQDLPVVSYPSLHVAAGAARSAGDQTPLAQTVLLPVSRTGPEFFAVRADGVSMDGGKRPIRDGDWLLLRWLDGAGLGAARDQVALIELPDGSGGHAYQIKRVVEREGRWWLASDNPEGPTTLAPEGARPLATLVQVVPRAP